MPLNKESAEILAGLPGILSQPEGSQPTNCTGPKGNWLDPHQISQKKQPEPTKDCIGSGPQVMFPSNQPYKEASNKLFGIGEYNDDGRHQYHGYISDIEINFGKVDTAIRALSTQASPGPDGIATSIYIKGGPVLITFLVVLFRAALDQSIAPDNMKMALISPIFKGGDKTLPSSYRPVALTSHLSKIM